MTVPVSRARAELPRLLDAVEAGHEVTITRHGKPIAVLVSNTAARTNRAAGAWAVVSDLRARRVPGADVRSRSLPRLRAGYAEELIADVRAARDGQHLPS